MVKGDHKQHPEELDDDDDDDDELPSLYNAYFGLGIALLNEPTLTVELETISARREMVKKDGDIREKVTPSLFIY